jgi:hypothetical protein
MGCPQEENSTLRQSMQKPPLVFRAVTLVGRDSRLRVTLRRGLHDEYADPESEGAP